MSLPSTICCQVYSKSRAVIGAPSLQTASGLMGYVTVTGGPALSSGGPASTGPGTYSPAGVTRNACGRVCTPSAQFPQDRPAQLAIQSAQNGSSCALRRRTPRGGEPSPGADAPTAGT